MGGKAKNLVYYLRNKSIREALSRLSEDMTFIHRDLAAEYQVLLDARVDYERCHKRNSRIKKLAADNPGWCPPLTFSKLSACCPRYMCVTHVLLKCVEE